MASENMSRGDVQQLRQQAAEYACTFIESGMVVGLGTGRTALLALHHLAKLLDNGQLQNVVAIPTSLAVEKEARHLGIVLTTLGLHPFVDLTIDGADEVDPHLDVIKGGGGALLSEKIVAQASQREMIIVDESKLSPMLGRQVAVPVEVITFGWESQRAYLIDLGADVNLRTDLDGSIFRTDNGNFILDCNFGPIPDPAGLAEKLIRRAGIVEHGLFLDMVTDLIVAGPGGIRHDTRGSASYLN